jgi:hypothetical protein
MRMVLKHNLQCATRLAALYARCGAELGTFDDSAQQRAISDGTAYMFGMYSADDKGWFEDHNTNVWLGYHKPAQQPEMVQHKRPCIRQMAVQQLVPGRTIYWQQLWC